MRLSPITILVNNKIKPFNKLIKVDSDKSQSIRSFIIGSICQGISFADNILESEDVKSTIAVCRKLGIKIERIKPQKYKIYGKGLGSFVVKKNSTLNFYNSGTASRLMIGVLSTTPNINVKVIGDHSLNKRSMKKLIDLMRKFGASFFPKEKNTFPLRLVSSNMPVAVKYNTDISAQLKSAVILASLNSYGSSIIKEKVVSRDHTENFLSGNKKAVKIIKGKNKIIKVYGKKHLNPFRISIGGDPSSAAFFTTLTLLNKKSTLIIKNVGLNSTRIGFYEVLKKQKAKIKFTNSRKENNEKKGDIIIKNCNLKPIRTNAKIYSKTTDEYLLLFLIAALTKGVSVFNGIEDLANKESSRALEMKKILEQLGVKCVLKKNQMKIFGKGMIDASDKKIYVGNLGDHRVAMVAFILGVLTKAKVKIKNFETVFTSSPSFLKIMKKLGAKFEIKK